MARSRVTLDDVAEASESSLATVSLALRNKPGVSRETRERILQTARDLGYQLPKRVARDEATDIRTIGLVFRTWTGGPERSSPALNPFYSWVLTGIQEAADSARMAMLLGTIPVDTFNRPTDFVEHLFQQPMDGLLLVGSHRSETVDQVIELLGAKRPPIVLVDCGLRHNQFDSVETDNELGVYQATREMLVQGHRKLSWFGPVSTWDRNFQERREGFRRALREADLEPVNEIESDGHLIDTGLDEAVFAGSTGMVCGNDDHALLLMRLATRYGVRIPEDISVIGFDDTTISRHATPALSTMVVDKLAMGRWAVQLLENRLAWPDSAPSHVTITPQLIRRQSVNAQEG